MEIGENCNVEKWSKIVQTTNSDDFQKIDFIEICVNKIFYQNMLFHSYFVQFQD